MRKYKGFIGIKFLIFISILFSCTTEKKNNADSNAEVITDTTEMIRGFIYGLWGRDSGNMINNEGYFFKPDGSVDFIAGEATGWWELTSNDTIKIVFSFFNEEFKNEYKIDSISEGRMTLTDKDGRYLFRKVPFGMNNEGTVLQGFSGEIEAGQQKEYTFEIPSARKINLLMKSEDTLITFRVYDNKEEISLLPLRDWTAIMVRNGKYRVVVSKSGGPLARFDLRVIGY